jgi:hypothetical protein
MEEQMPVPTIRDPFMYNSQVPQSSFSSLSGWAGPIDGTDRLGELHVGVAHGPEHAFRRDSGHVQDDNRWYCPEDTVQPLGLGMHYPHVRRAQEERPPPGYAHPQS